MVTDYTTLSGVVASTDVEEITVLKDAASTAIYGSRAATGVIVVTTKKGGEGPDDGHAGCEERHQCAEFRQAEVDDFAGIAGVRGDDAAELVEQ